MRKTVILILIVLFSSLCFACGKLSFQNGSENKLVFEAIEKPNLITYETCAEAIAKGDKGYRLIIVRDDDKDFGNIDNSHGTIDENLRQHREKVREYFTEKNNAFIKKHKLNKLCDNIYASEYTSFIILSFSNNNLSKDAYNLIVKLANSVEVGTIYLSCLDSYYTNY